MKKVKYSFTGFTLLEFLVYIGIVGTVLLISGTIALNVLFGKAKLTAIEEVNQNARFAMENFMEKVRNAEHINSPAQGASAAALSLQMADPTKNPTVFDVADGVVRIQEGTGTVTGITSKEAAVTALQFSNISYPNTPGTVRIHMTIKLVNPENRPEYSFEKTFYTTSNIRKK